MSEVTKAALDAAIAAHVADECDGAIITGYVLQSQYTDMDMLEDGYTGYVREIMTSQPFTTTLGLAHYLSRQVDRSMFEDGYDKPNE